MSTELLRIANMDLQASRVLYENGLYPQAIFYFQQSVEKACKTFALITNQVTEKELPREVGHETLKIYEKVAKQQMITFKQIEENLNKIPELKTLALLKDFDIRKNINEFERSLTELKGIKKEKDDLIYISSRDIRFVLKEIRLINRDIEWGRCNLSKIKISERAWNKMKAEMLEFYKVLLKNDSTQFEEIRSSFNKTDMKSVMEKAIKDLFAPAFIILPLSISLYYLAIITLPHSIIARYPVKDLTPLKIYTKRLPVVKMLPKLFEVQDTVLRELETLDKNLENGAK